MRQLFLSILIFSTTANVFSQTEKTPDSFELNSIYAEPFGQGFFGSLNYDRLINVEETVMNSINVGIVFAPESADFGDGQYLGIPVCYNFIWGKKKHHFATGLGGTALLSSNNSIGFSQPLLYVYGAVKMGYRYQRPTGGLFFKADMSILISIFTHNLTSFNSMQYFSDIGGIGFPIIPWPSFSLGYSF